MAFISGAILQGVFCARIVSVILRFVSQYGQRTTGEEVGFGNKDDVSRGFQYNLRMRVYLDICCLKRPFDDQSQPRIHLEAEAVLALLDASGKQIEFLHAAAHDLENEQNSLPSRAARVREWLDHVPLADLADDVLQARTDELIALGFKSFDAFHLASAEAGGVEVFATCDDRLQAAATRHSANLKVRVVNPVDLAREVLP